MTASPVCPPLRRRGPVPVTLAVGAALLCSAFTLPHPEGRVSFGAEGVELRSIDGTRMVVGRDSARLEAPWLPGPPRDAAVRGTGGAAPTPRPAAGSGSGGDGAARPLGREPTAPAAAATPAAHRPAAARSTPEPAPARSPNTAVPGREARSAPAPEPVQARYGYAPPSAPVADRHRFAGAVSTWLLSLLAVATLALRLTIGWPRFPPRYRGRRRVRGR
ncbi:hypothetical protein [Marinitenerispora sediminis]|uniref:Uncharacterized protein n=1 Tax=Marinitenerispora sediminis TaxID=1931232 RepID=A0A368TBB4_9ACTN|nr:hypothetical protein [Marinitenerispora sediminis]RCV53641.1 hypothetical protein DEF28_09905 [Marinitenerispora sediminis]RCV57376.1 hypothetical protein DEF23_10980 [Marinitenerispora sediminis]RCV62345.1 hypothetical protein DEF24_01515 [Marinitenerispora sediminis]